MAKIIELPDRNVMILIVFLSALFLAVTLYRTFVPPAGMVYASTSDDEAYFVAIEKSYLWDLKNPWLLTETAVFYDAPLGSGFALVPVGILAFVLNIDARIFLIMLKTLFTFAYFVIIYSVVSHFVKDKNKKIFSFLFFSVAAGLGWVAYTALKIYTPSFVNPSSVDYMLTGNNVFITILWSQLHLLMGLVAGYASFLLLIKKQKYLLSALLLGLSVLFYPVFGLFFVLLSVVYLFTEKTLQRNLKYVLLSLLSVVPWAYLYLTNDLFFEEYKNSLWAYTNIYVFLFSGGIVLALSAYAAYSYFKKGEIQKNKFLLLWGVILIVLTLFPSRYAIILPTRFLQLVWLPLSILAADVLFDVARKRGKILAILVVLLSVPTLFVFFFMHPANAGLYASEDDMSAMLFMRGLPQGGVISSKDTGVLIPEYAEKRSLVGRKVSYLEEEIVGDDWKIFYSSPSEQEKLEILKKYSIRYVFFGENEKKINPDFSLSGLELIYDRGTKVYEFTA